MAGNRPGRAEILQNRHPELHSDIPLPLEACAVVIGASAGGIEALKVILPSLPTGFALPVFVVIHVSPDRDSLLADIFKSHCCINVKDAEDKELIEGGNIYFAPSNYHLLVETNGKLSLSTDNPVMYSRPSINVLFEAAADAYHSQLIGIVLTGANSDGATGLKAICDAGGAAIVQDPDEAIAAPMPLAALNACPKAYKMNLKQISEYLRKVKLAS